MIMKTLGEYVLALLLIILMIPAFIFASLLALFDIGHQVKIRQM